MILQIGKVTQDNRVVNKAFSITKAMNNVVVDDDTNILTPVFILEYPNTLDINYCYCGTFGRYYYVDSVEIMTGKRVALHCRCDVLNTYKTQIRATYAIVNKTDKGDTYLNDGSFVNECKSANTIIKFPAALNDTGEFILVVAGA